MKKLLIISAAIVAFAACKKEDDTTTKAPAEYLKAGKWFLAAETEREQGNGVDTTYDYMSDYAPCELDNYMLFTQDSAFYDNGVTKCDPSDPQVIETATWSLIDNNNKIVVKYVGGNDTLNISALNATTLEFTDVFTSSNGTTYTYIQRYKH